MILALNDIAAEYCVALAAEFAPDFVPVVSYQPQILLEDLSSLAVRVIPRTLELATAARKMTQATSFVDVVVQRRLLPTTSDQPKTEGEQIKDVIDIVDQIAKWSMAEARKLIAAGGAQLLRMEFSPSVVSDLNERRVITAVLTLPYLSMEGT